MTQLSTIVIDCADPKKLAGFYKAALGLEITYSDDDFVYLGDRLAFQRVANYRGPSWPDDGKHAHLDLQVDDLSQAEELIKLGATRPDFQPGGDKWVVLRDPEGHPFCLTTSN